MVLSLSPRAPKRCLDYDCPLSELPSCIWDRWATLSTQLISSRACRYPASDPTVRIDWGLLIGIGDNGATTDHRPENGAFAPGRLLLLPPLPRPMRSLA